MTRNASRFGVFPHSLLSSKDVELLNPNTRTCPIFRSRRDAELPVLCGRGKKGGRMRAEEAWKNMTKRIEVQRAPAPLEEYVKHFDALLGKSNQRAGFR